MRTFDEQLVQKYYDNKQFGAAADYFENLLVDGRHSNGDAYGGKEKKYIRDKISQLRRDEAIQNTYLNNATDEEKEAYKFWTSYNGGNYDNLPKNTYYDINNKPIDSLSNLSIYDKDLFDKIIAGRDEIVSFSKNRFGSSYTRDIENLKTKDDKDVKYVGLEITSDEDLARLQDMMGIPDIKKNDLGINYYNNGGGKHTINVDVKNTNLYKILKAGHKLNEAKYKAGQYYVPEDLKDSESVIHWASGKRAAMQNIYNRHYGTGDGFKLIASTSDGVIIKNDPAVYEKLYGIKDNVEKAETLYNDLMDRVQNNEESFISPITVTSYLGIGHANAAYALSQGAIDIDDYNKITKNWEDIIGNMLSTVDITGKKIYAWDLTSGEGKVLQEVDDIDKPYLEAKIRTALADGRLSYNYAMKDGKTGMKLTISGKKSTSNGQKSPYDKLLSGEFAEQDMDIFVEGLFKSQADAMFERDTKTKSVRQLSDISRWNYETKLENDKTIGHDVQRGYYLKEYNSLTQSYDKIPIGEEEALHILNEGNIISDSITKLLEETDEDGNLKPRKNNKGEWYTPNKEKVIENIAINATNELYPKGTMSDLDREVYKKNLYLRILKLLNWYTNSSNNDNVDFSL